MSGSNKPPFYLIDTKSEFYRPLGVRAAICIAVVAWAAMELWHADPFWSVISLASAVYCVYVLFITYKPPEVAPPPTAAAEETPAEENDNLPKS